MAEHVEPDPEMEAFFQHPRITHRKTRNWSSPPGQRHWFAIDQRLTLEEARNLLGRLPVGAFVQSFDWMYDSPSDPGAYSTFRRFPAYWTVSFSNHGWGTSPVPIDFEAAARLYWDGLLIDDLYFMGYQRNREPKPPGEHMAHSGLPHDCPDRFQENTDEKIGEYLRRRVRSTDEASRSPPSPND